MLENLISALLAVTAAYLGCGVVVAALFVACWCKAFDPSAKEGSWGFRVLVTPGIVILWPVILTKVLRIRRGGSAEGRVEGTIRAETLRRNHALAFVVLLLLGPVLFAVALAWRAPRLADVPPVELATKLNAH
jgi:hypothetical protein